MRCGGSLSLVLLVAAALLLACVPGGCRERSPAADPSTFFRSSGGESVRDLGIYAGEERVGDLRVSRRNGTWEGEGPAVEIAESVHLRLSFRKDRFSLSYSQTSWISDSMELLGSAGNLDFGAGGWQTTLLKMEKGTYRREQATTGSLEREVVRVPSGTLPSDALPLYLERFRGEKGHRERLTIFNFTMGREFPLLLEFRDEEPEGRLFSLSYWGMQENLWVDDRGMVARADMLLGVQARSPAGEERTGYLSLEKVLSQTAVPGVGIPSDLGARQEAVLSLEGALSAPPGGRWQTVETGDQGTTVRLLRPVIPEPGDRKPDPELMPRDGFGLDLDSGRIQELAREITGSTVDPWQKSLDIGRWVHDNLGKSMKECFSALQVLESGEGECQSHSLLAVALSRAAGLPARFVYGVVYLPERKAFGFHTWVEVHVGEWIPMDPTLGNFPAGVDHLTLAAGGYRDQFSLFPYVMGEKGWRIRFSD